MLNIISNFHQAPYNFLSNFYQCEFWFYDFKFTSVEQFYQYSKAIFFENFEIADRILETLTPSKAKALGKQVKMNNKFVRFNWENQEKIEKMKTGLFEKFSQNEDLKQRLIETAPNLLVELNTWNDTFWGITYDGKGTNWLGLLLMLLRSQFQNL